MAIDPESVIQHYKQVVGDGQLPKLKAQITSSMTDNFQRNAALASEYSNLLSAIDNDYLSELDPDDPILFHLSNTLQLFV